MPMEIHEDKIIMRAGKYVWPETAIQEAVEAEREACAKVLDEMADYMESEMEPSESVAWVRSKAALIRARGEK